MFKRAKRKVPGLNTSSTADISFMLLIFFLVTTSMEMDNGLNKQLPPIEKNKKEQPSMVNENLVMRFQITANDKINLNGKPIDPQMIKSSVLKFIESRGKEHIIQVESDRKATYNAYFLLQNEIVAAYNVVRNKKALAEFGQTYETCNMAQKQQINDEIPQRISEVYHVSTTQQQEGGPQ